MNNVSQDFIAFEGDTLEEAYKKASLEFQCSIMNLKSDIIQAPSNGFFGLFKKNAIIKVYRCDRNESKEEIEVLSKTTVKNDINIKDVSSKMKEMHQDAKDETNFKTFETKEKHIEHNNIFNTFYEKETQNFDEIKIIKSDKVLAEVKEKIDTLFGSLSYELEPVKVSYYDGNTLYIEFSGKDSALLIGKEGYRYKAISYILFNWIHEQYNLMIRLEIAEFLTSQEESIHRYLEPVIETIKQEGFYKTKNLDGILIHIALTRLRAEFPQKYIAVKSNIKGEKYILVNEYRK
jgi:spoIIIJ-associated protein